MDKFHGQYCVLTQCPDCPFKSSMFCSFAVLHVGIPPPSVRTIVFTLIDVCGNQPPKNYTLELSLNISVEDLYHEAAKLIDCREDRPWEHLCFVLKREEFIFLQLSDVLERIRYSRISTDAFCAHRCLVV